MKTPHRADSCYAPSCRKSGHCRHGKRIGAAPVHARQGDACPITSAAAPVRPKPLPDRLLPEILHRPMNGLDSEPIRVRIIKNHGNRIVTVENRDRHRYVCNVATMLKKIPRNGQ